MKILLSVIIATYNRPSKIILLLEDLIKQKTPVFEVECIVTNDGSQDNTEQVLNEFLENLKTRHLSNFRLKVLNQSNSGQARARQNAIEVSSGDVLVILDDDMRIPSVTFLRSYFDHFYSNNSQVPENKVVLGRMDPPEDGITRKPFEYFYERSLEQKYSGFISGKLKPKGGDLFTGNVALTKKAFIECGGFSEKFKYAEDKELGLRLETISKSVFVFETRARSIHYSDTPSMKVFAARAKKHGFFDCEIQKLYPSMPELGPANLLNLPGKFRSLIVYSLLNFKFLRNSVIAIAFFVADFVIHLNMKKLASFACSFVYIGEYMNGALEGMHGLQGLKRNLIEARLRDKSQK
jgi:glycosyltransferase involved in cell wall biosynthesis